LPVIALLVSEWVRLRLEVFFDELLHSSSWRAKSVPGETCEPLCTWCKALDPPGLPWFIIVQCKTWPLFWVLCETTPFRRSQGFNVIPLNMFFPANSLLRFGNNLYKGWHGGAGGKPGWLLEPEGMQSIQIDLCSHIDQEHETLLSNKHK